MTEKPHLLFDLPPEILLMVSEYLSDADVASLALCNHGLLSFFPRALQKISSVGNRSLWFSEIPKSRSDLLTRLSHDSPDFHFCFNCQMLARSQDVELPNGWLSASHSGDHIDECLPSQTVWMPVLRLFREANPPEENITFGRESGVCFRIYYVHVQLAIRALRSGPQFGIPIEAFSFTKVEIGVEHHFVTDYDQDSTTSHGAGEEDRDEDASEGDGDEHEVHKELDEEREPEYFSLPQTTLFSLDARAESNPPNFYIRSQCLLVLPKDRILNWVQETDERISNDTCPCLTIGMDSGFQASIESLVGEYVRDHDKTPQREGQCDKCCMSWLIKMRTINDSEACFNLTQWRNLGSGLDPLENQWLFHASIGLDNHSVLGEGQRCDPRQKFEEELVPAGGLNALSEKELFDRNISWLDRRAYETVMSPSINGNWWLNVWEYMPRRNKEEDSLL